MEPFDTGKNSVYFIVKNNSSIKRVIKIFNTKIGPGQQLDLMAIPGITEEDIKASLLKGPLNQLLNNKTIQIVSSTINLASQDPTFAQFLNDNNAYSSLATNPRVLTQTNWYIDPVNGEDANDGKTSATPIKTWAELLARYGTISPILTVGVTITFLNDQQNANDPIIFRPFIATGGSIIITSQLKQVTWGTTTLGTVTPLNRATGTLLQVNLGQAASAAVATLLIDTTTNACAWVDSANGNVATMTQPYQPMSIVLGQEPARTQKTLTAGDTFGLWAPCKVYVCDFQPQHIAADANTAIYAYLYRIYIVDPAGTSFTPCWINQQVHVFECVSSKFIQMPRAAASAEWFPYWVNSWVSGCGDFYRINITGGAYNTGTPYTMFISDCFLDGDGIYHGNCNVASDTSSNSSSSVSSGYFESLGITGGVIYAVASGSAFTAGLYGKTGWTLGLFPGAKLGYKTSAATTFLFPPSFLFNGSAAVGWSVNNAQPSVLNGNISVTAANIDAAFGATGFGGTVVDLVYGIHIFKAS